MGPTMAEALVHSQGRSLDFFVKTAAVASQDLGSGRVRLVLGAIATERGHGWQSDLSRKTGIHQTTWSKIAQGERGAGRDVITALSNVLGIDPRFFTEPSLGDAPDYRRFVGRETHVELDDERHRVVEDFITEQRLEPSTAEDFRRTAKAFGGNFVRDDLVRLLPVIRERDARLCAEAAGEPDPAPRDLALRRRHRQGAPARRATRPERHPGPGGSGSAHAVVRACTGTARGASANGCSTCGRGCPSLAAGAVQTPPGVAREPFRRYARPRFRGRATPPEVAPSERRVARRHRGPQDLRRVAT